MTPVTAGITGLVSLIVLMFLRIPVGFVMAIVGFRRLWVAGYLGTPR